MGSGLLDLGGRPIGRSAARYHGRATALRGVLKAVFISISLQGHMAVAPDPQVAPIIPLAALAPGRRAVIVALDAVGPVGARLGDLGFVPGTRIAAVRRAPLGDPTLYALRGCELALRRSEAACVLVRPEDGA
jgi:ferrous iron transport protein A